MALNVANIVKLEKPVEPVKEQKQQPVLSKNNEGSTVKKSGLNVNNLVITNQKVNPVKEVVKQIEEKKQDIDGKEKLKMSYFLMPKDSDYLSHNVKHNRR